MASEQWCFHFGHFAACQMGGRRWGRGRVGQGWRRDQTQEQKREEPLALEGCNAGCPRFARNQCPPVAQSPVPVHCPVCGSPCVCPVCPVCRHLPVPSHPISSSSSTVRPPSLGSWQLPRSQSHAPPPQIPLIPPFPSSAFSSRNSRFPPTTTALTAHCTPAGFVGKVYPWSAPDLSTRSIRLCHSFPPPPP